MEDSPKDGCLRYPSGESLESLKSPSFNTSSKIKQQRSHSLYANKLASDFAQVKRNLTNNNYDEPFFKIYDDPSVLRSYSNVPILEIQQLPRGGLSFETKAVGRIQVIFFSITSLMSNIFRNFMISIFICFILEACITCYYWSDKLYIFSKSSA